MALFDWPGSSLRPQNSIGAGPKGRAATPTPDDPETVTRSYYVEEKGKERRYYDDYRKQALAITASPDRIQSRRDDLYTIRAMLALAEARGWTELRVTGSAEFRREAWIEASARGLTVAGHRPTDPERQEAERRRAERERDRRTTADRNPTEPLHGAKVGSDQARTSQGREPEPALSADGRLVLAALSEKIDREMIKLSREVKAEVKAFAAAELARRERREGPVVLTEAQRAMARAPRREPPSPPPSSRRQDIEPPRLVRGR